MRLAICRSLLWGQSCSLLAAHIQCLQRDGSSSPLFSGSEAGCCCRAHAQPQQRVIRSDEIIYNSDRGSEEVDDAGADFDRRLNEEQQSSEQLADARLLWDQKQQQQKQQRRQRGGW